MDDYHIARNMEGKSMSQKYSWEKIVALLTKEWMRNEAIVHHYCHSPGEEELQERFFLVVNLLYVHCCIMLRWMV